MRHSSLCSVLTLSICALGCDPAPWLLPSAGSDAGAGAVEPTSTAAASTASPAPPAPDEEAPEVEGPALTGERFSELFRGLSEPDGDYQGGFVSNELRYLDVATALAARAPGGGAYVGVGPEQNFTYIALTEPDRAYIVDVRRDNALLHLLYKAAFEEAGSRVSFLALVIGRGEGDDDPSDASIDEIIREVTLLDKSEGTFRAAHERLIDRIDGYDLRLTEEDGDALARIHRELYTGGVDLRMAGPCQGERLCGMVMTPPPPRLRQLLMATDPVDGKRKSFLARRASFELVQRMQRENRVVPVVADLSGPKGLRALGEHLRADGLDLSVLYVSNVEPVLRRNGGWDAWRVNLGRLPRDPDAVMVSTATSQSGLCGTTVMRPSIGPIDDGCRSPVAS